MGSDHTADLWTTYFGQCPKPRARRRKSAMSQASKPSPGFQGQNATQSEWLGWKQFNVLGYDGANRLQSYGRTDVQAIVWTCGDVNEVVFWQVGKQGKSATKTVTKAENRSKPFPQTWTLYILHCLTVSGDINPTKKAPPGDLEHEDETFQAWIRKAWIIPSWV